MDGPDTGASVLYQHPEIWYSVDKLRPYYKFICLLRTILDEAIKEENDRDGSSVSSGFDTWDTPNGLYWRTENAIYLSITWYHLGKGVIECVERLATPFGYSTMLGSGGNHGNQCRVSHSFLKRLPLYGISARVVDSIRIMESKRGRAQVSDTVHQSLQLSHPTLLPPQIEQDHHVYECPFVNNDISEEVFKIVSNGLEKFVPVAAP